MNGHYGCLMKIEKDSFVYKKLRLKNEEIYRKPYFSILNEDSTARLFIDAILRDATEEAFCYMSRSIPTNIDLHEIQGLLNSSVDYKYLIKAESGTRSKGCKTNSILIINEECRNSIIHVHLVREPDRFGKWKIFGINCERS